MVARTRSCSTNRRISGSGVVASSLAQSTGVPSTTAPARLIKRPSLPGMAHLHCKPDDGSSDGHPGRIRTRLAEHDGHFLVAALQFDARDNRFALLVAKLSQCGFIPLGVFLSDRLFERRCQWAPHVVRQFLGRSTPLCAPQLVPDPVHDGLAQVRLECALPRSMETIYMP